jgi:SAM-dependent methyltransferase
MRKTIKNFIKVCAETLPMSEPIYEFGSLQVAEQRGFADLRPLFPGKRYVGADMREGPGVDKVLNLHSIDLPSGSAGTVLILDTLEHVEYPRRAIEEAHRILGPDGIVIISSVMCFPIHDYPHDYWRFTPEAFKNLLKNFSRSLVFAAGEASLPHTVVGLGFKGAVSKEVLDKLKERLEETKPLRSDWIGLAALVVPPVLWNLYRKLRPRPK